MAEGETPPVLVASPQDDVREVLARVVETGGLDAVRLDADDDVVEAVVNSRAGAVICDLGGANLTVLRALRERPEEAAASVRVIVIGTGPAGGRLAWQAGADGYLLRPFHARDLQAALAEAFALDDDGRAARRSPGVPSPTASA